MSTDTLTHTWGNYVFDKILILDFETRWAKRPVMWAPNPDGTPGTYTLSSMTVEEYVRSPLFKAFGCGYKYYGESGRPVYLTHEVLVDFFNSIDWSTTAVCCHNAQFDVSILTWIYGHKPAFIIDTLSMARALRGLEVGNSAAKLADDLGLPPKGNATQSSDGLFELPFSVAMELAEYCKHDVWLAEKFLEHLSVGYPFKEMRLIDMTIRMYTEPQLELDTELLSSALEEEAEIRNSLLQRLKIEEAQLSSNDKFAEALRMLGADPPTKTSKTTGKEAFAFAKNDAAFQQLINSDDENIALLCEARLRVKSTQERTRAQRFLDISRRGRLPVPVNYAHTRTLRWGAAKGSNINMQNLKRGGRLRRSVVAPAGHQCVAGDLSQIEPRVLAYLADFTSLLETFKSADPYSLFGRVMFGIPDLAKDTHPDLRQSAKSAMLGCGYLLGWASFAAQLLVGFLGAPPVRYDKKFMERIGIGSREVIKFMEGPAGRERLERMMDIPRTCTDQELLVHCVCAKEIIDRYRASSGPIVAFWDFLGKMLATVIAVPGAQPVRYKCITFAPGRITLPNGLPVLYDKIEVAVDKKGRPQYSYWNGKKRKPLHPGILAENVVSGTARCVIADGMLRVQARYRCAMPVHDEGVWVVPDAEVDEAKVWIKEQMIAPVRYLPGIPLNADVGAHRRYGDAKK